VKHPSIIVSKTNRNVFIAASALIAVTATILVFRFAVWEFNLLYVMPDRVYTVNIAQSFNGNGAPVQLSVFIPRSDARQKVLFEDHLSQDLLFETSDEGQNRVAKWHSSIVEGPRKLSYTVRLHSQAIRYEVDKSILIADADTAQNAPKEMVQATSTIQSDAPEIVKLANKITPSDGSLLSFLRNAYEYVLALGYKPFKGTTDALLTLKLKKASCNGKSRLFAALLRANGIAARLVGGLVMSNDLKRASHQWVEAYVNGVWIPFDPTNNHFAEIPGHYIVLYRGDEILFRHTADIGFQYEFASRKKMVPRQEIDPEAQVMGFWKAFNQIGVSFELLKSIIMVPIGAVVIVLFRNVIGLRTFGTFLPVLIAVACRNTGLLWGLIGFVAIVTTVSIIRAIISKLQLLHSPQLGVLLTGVIGMLLLAAVLGARFYLSGLAKVSLFPMVIVAITAERFAIMEIEDGRKTAWKTMAETLIVVSACYIVISSLSLQIVMLAFPELLLLTVVMHLWIGRWVGIRFSEWFRFRWFVLNPERKKI
jgi:hypothetical protein